MKKRVNLTFQLLICTILPLFAENWNIERRWDYACDHFFNVKVRGDIAYCTTTYGLVLMDVSDPTEPEIFQRIPFEGAGLGMELINTLLYICDNEAGLRIFSIADPELPVEIGRCSDLPNPIRLQIRDTLAYVSNYRAGLGIVSIADPYHPERIGWLNVGGDCNDVAVYEDYAFISSGSVKLISIEDPTRPEQVALFPEMALYEIETRSNYLFISSFKIFDITNPFEPREIFYHGGRQGVYGGGFDFHNEMIFICNGEPRDYDLQCYDIEDLESPRFLGGCNPFGGHSSEIDLEYESGYCYVTYGDEGFSICDMRDIDNAEEVAVIINPADFVDVAYYEDYAYVADEKRAWIYIFSVADPVHPELIGHVGYDRTGSIDFGPIVVEGDLLYSVEKYRYYDDNELFERNGLYIYSLENPEQPEELGCLRNFSGINKIVIDGNIAYLARGGGHFTVVNIDDPSSPEVLGYYGRSNSHIDGIDFNDSLLTLCIDDTLIIYNKSDLDSIHVISRQILREHYGLRDILIVGNYAYVTYFASAWMSVVSIEDPEHPEEVYFTDELGSYGYKLDYRNCFLLITEWGVGLEVYSIEDPERPQLAGRFNTPDRAKHAIFKDEMILVADRCNFGIYDASAIFSAWYLGLSEESHDFGEVYIDSSARWLLSISNYSDQEREITNITTDNDVFTCTFDSAFTLRAHSNRIIAINFTPSEDTTYMCNLIIVSGEHILEVMLSGQGKEYNSVTDTPEIIYDFELQGAYPNPFNSTTRISYSLDRDAFITLKLYDLSGREIRTLIAGFQSKGKHLQQINGTTFPSGIYILKLEAERRIDIKKVVCIK